jgi:hypothetical protein
VDIAPIAERDPRNRIREVQEASESQSPNEVLAL